MRRLGVLPISSRTLWRGRHLYQEDAHSGMQVPHTGIYALENDKHTDRSYTVEKQPPHVYCIRSYRRLARARIYAFSMT